MILHIVAPDVTRHGSTSAISEAALVRGYGVAGDELVPTIDRVVAPQPCACGGVIDPELESEIAAAVAAHNATPRHHGWRARTGR